jgi:hypothetical protein
MLQESTMAQDDDKGLLSFSLTMPDPSNSFMTIDHKPGVDFMKPFRPKLTSILIWQ